MKGRRTKPSRHGDPTPFARNRQKDLNAEAAEEQRVSVSLEPDRAVANAFSPRAETKHAEC